MQPERRGMCSPQGPCSAAGWLSHSACRLASRSDGSMDTLFMIFLQDHNNEERQKLSVSDCTQQSIL